MKDFHSLWIGHLSTLFFFFLKNWLFSLARQYICADVGWTNMHFWARYKQTISVDSYVCLQFCSC
jgi:hypothetical protein